MPFISTERLQMITFSADMMEALLKENSQLEKMIPYKVPPEYPLDVYKEWFPYKIERFRKFLHENDWEGMIIHKKDQIVMGDMGFKGGPDEKGIMDIGYSIIPSYQGKGYATEMGKAMAAWGLSQPNVKKIKATCNPENMASIRVLEKIGFHLTRKSVDKLFWSY